MTARRRHAIPRLGRALACCGALGLLGACAAAGEPRGSNGPPAAPPPDGPGVGAGPVEGLQTSAREVRAIGESARRGVAPHRENVDQLLAIADRGWPHGPVDARFEGRIHGDDVYDKICQRTTAPTDEGILPVAGRPLYALVLAHLLTGREGYAREARSVLLEFAASSGFDEVEGETRHDGSNQCALELSLLAPLLIESAMLLEAYPGWGAADRRALGDWLAGEVYPVTSAIARTRKNNWGTAAAFASWAVAHYLLGTDARLEEVHPARRTLTPEQAKASHLRAQLRIVGRHWRGDSRCERFGFQPHGGYPDELRRGSTGCDGKYLLDEDGSYAYQMTTASHLIYHAEALRRHGGNELYTLRLDDGPPTLLRAITFVIDNGRGPSRDWERAKLGVLRVANTFYDDARLCEAFADSSLFHEGRYLPFARLTHPGACRPAPG